MKIAVTLHTTNYRGDHEAEVTVAHELLPAETIEAVAERLLVDKARYAGGTTTERINDWIEVRLIVTPEASK